MAGAGVEADGGAAGGDHPSGPPGGHAVSFFGDEVWRCSCGLAWDDQSGGWGATIINHLYLHPVRALPPSRSHAQWGAEWLTSLRGQPDDREDLRGVPPTEEGRDPVLSGTTAVSLPPPHRGDRSFDKSAGFYWVHVPERPGHPAGWPWVQEPEWPEPYRRRVQEVSHRVWQDYGTDGTTRWPRWWCSCGAHGQGWPANHGDSR